MGVVSDYFDAFDTKVASTLTSHGELSNPYFPERSSQITLAASFGVKMDAGDNLLLNEAAGAETRQRQLGLVLTRRKFATKQNIAARKSVEKQLFEDLELVLDAVAQDQTLGVQGIQRILYSSDSGVQFLELEDNRVDVYFLEASFLVDYEVSVQLCV